ncbi:hypothetical protein FRC02_009271 [Tulasnella sp. 418]|nr:hypothetical protein FRC02_009271 [Tulasnella sp. 418]
MHDSHPKRRTRPCVYYQQGICNRPNCNFSHEISTNLSSNSDTTSPLPGSISTPSVQSQLGDEHDRGVLRSRPCRYFAKGRCTAGDSCRWSHDEEAFLEDGVMHPSAYEDPELVTPGFKLVPKSYRTLPCARYEKGHCMYGDACTFIHSTPAASSAPTPSARDPRELDSLGPSPPAIMIKPHSHHPSPIRPHLPSPSMSTNNVHQLSSPLATTSITANGSSLPLAQTISRELPPPSSHFGGTNWAISTASQQQPSSMSAIGRTSTPVFAGSPLLNSLGNEWSHPQPSPLHQSVSSTSQMQQQSRSPFLYTFGEIAPPAKDGPSSFSGNSALTQPRQDSPAPKSLGLGLNGASLATQGAIGLGTSPSANGMLAPGGPSNGTTNSNVAPLSVANLISSRAGLPISSTSSPAIGLRRSLHGTGTGGGPGSDIGVSVARRLMGNGTGHSRVPSYDTDEPDFPSISYNEFTVDGENEKDDLASVGAGSVGAGSGVGLKLGTNGGGTLYGGNGDENGDSRASIQRWAGHGRMGSLGGSGRPMRYGPGGAYGDLNSYDEQSYRISYKTRPCKFFVAGSRCPSGQQCTFIHDPSSVRSGPTNGGPGYGPPPGTYGPPGMLAITNPEQHPLYRTRECKYHLAGHCHQEESCAFKHTGPAGQGREYENWEGFSLQIRDYENGDDRGPFRGE